MTVTGMVKTPKPSPQIGAAPSGGTDAAPATEPTTAPVATEALGQAVADTGTGATSPSAAADEPKSATLVITGPKQGRWRAKRHFGAEPVSIPANELTEEEIALLKGDPALTVRTIEAPY